MSHQPLCTCGAIAFGKTINGNTLFTLKPDVPARDALEHASILQNCANALLAETALGADPAQHLALSALYLNEMAKAIMDDVAHGLNMTL